MINLKNPIKLSIVAILFTIGLTYSQQNVVTKYKHKGNLISSPGEISPTVWKFKKGEIAYVMEYADNDWWLLYSPSGKGYAHSNFIKLNKDVLELKEIKRLNDIREETIRRERDSLSQVQKKINDSIYLIEKKFNDSIIKIYNRKKDSIYRLKQIEKDSINAILVKAEEKRLQAEKNKFEKLLAKYNIDPKNLPPEIRTKGMGMLYEKPSKNSTVLGENTYDYVVAVEYVNGFFLVLNISGSGYLHNSNVWLHKESAKILMARGKYIDVIKKYGKITGTKILNGEYWIGMTESMAISGGWYPGSVKVNRTVNRYGTSEQWVCKRGVYLYFDDGILTAFQD